MDILASASPRRKELLALLLPQFIVETAPVDETDHPPLPPRELVALLAARKARAVADRFPADRVIGSDTVVAVDGQILGKPQSPEEAVGMLRTLSGRTHTVYTAVCVCSPEGERQAVSSTQVTFAPMSEEEIDWYVATGEPMDKAGAYGIQGYGARFIREIQGDFYTVMGLPVQKLYQLLTDPAPQWP